MANLKNEIRSNDGRDASLARVDMKFELVVIPVSDVDRAKEFYGRLGWRLDADYASGDDYRVIQLRRLAPGVRSSSARTSPGLHPAPFRACT
jgi:catechol 2,3-dioxygenase-like lactoylglutathione lyase family enzyme